MVSFNDYGFCKDIKSMLFTFINWQKNKETSRLPAVSCLLPV